MNDMTKQGLHRSTIQDHEVRVWSHRFGVSEAEVMAAIRTVGNDANAVRQRLHAMREYLRRGRARRPSSPVDGKKSATA